MRIIICDSILKKELKGYTDKQLKDAAEKIAKGICDNLPWTPEKPELKKAKIGKYRFAFLYYGTKSILIPICARIKADKNIGNNMAMSNQKFVSLLDTYFDLVEKDLLEEKYSFLESKQK